MYMLIGYFMLASKSLTGAYIAVYVIVDYQWAKILHFLQMILIAHNPHSVSVRIVWGAHVAHVDWTMTCLIRILTTVSSTTRLPFTQWPLVLEASRLMWSSDEHAHLIGTPEAVRVWEVWGVRSTRGQQAYASEYGMQQGNVLDAYSIVSKKSDLCILTFKGRQIVETRFGVMKVDVLLYLAILSTLTLLSCA